MLADRYDPKNLQALLLPPERIAPFPKAADRAAWEALAQATRRRWVEWAEPFADYAWPMLKTKDYRRYWIDGDLQDHSNARFERRTVLGVLALAECIEGRGRFLDPIIDGICAICEETTWVPQLHRLQTKENMLECMPAPEDRMVELHTCATSDLLLWIRYAMRDRLDAVSVRICRRIEQEVRVRLLEPYMERDDYWWMGFREGVRVNNWNPWCNSSALMGFLLLEHDPGRRAEAIWKILRSLDAFIGTYPADGCCDEGPGYWAHSGGGLYTALELLAEASGGTIDVFGEPLIRDIGGYIYKTHIHGDYFVNFADGDVKPVVGGGLVYRYGRAIADENMVRLGAVRPEEEPNLRLWFGMYAHLRSMFDEQGRLERSGGAPYARDAWFPVSQVMTARQSEGSAAGLFLAAKGGHNLESHNHNDVGSFVVFVDGYPLFIDPGTEEYSAQTFGPDRYELWYLQSQYHNLPTVNGTLQPCGAEYRGKQAVCRLDDSGAELSLDISEAYPPEAGIVSWRRTFRLHRAAEPAIEVTDAFVLTAPSQRIFYSLITPCEPIRSPKEVGKLRFEYAPGRWAALTFDAERLSADIERIGELGSRLRRNWGDNMYRIVLREQAPVTVAERVIRIAADRPPASASVSWV